MVQRDVEVAAQRRSKYFSRQMTSSLRPPPSPLRLALLGPAASESSLSGASARIAAVIASSVIFWIRSSQRATSAKGDPER